MNPPHPRRPFCANRGARKRRYDKMITKETDTEGFCYACGKKKLGDGPYSSLEKYFERNPDAPGVYKASGDLWSFQRDFRAFRAMGVLTVIILVKFLILLFVVEVLDISYVDADHWAFWMYQSIWLDDMLDAAFDEIKLVFPVIVVVCIVIISRMIRTHTHTAEEVRETLEKDGEPFTDADAADALRKFGYRR